MAVAEKYYLQILVLASGICCYECRLLQIHTSAEEWENDLLWEKINCVLCYC